MPIRNQSPLRDHVDLGATNNIRIYKMAVKKYVINYSSIGGGAIEVEAHSICEAENLFNNTSYEIFLESTDWKKGFEIESMEIEDGDQYFEYQYGQYQGDDYEKVEEE